MPDDTRAHDDRLRDCVAGIVAAYLNHNDVPPTEISAVIETVYNSLTVFFPVHVPEPPQPAVDPADSITSSALVCLECGERHRRLKRHLRDRHGLDEHAYRRKWSLPHDYPMVCAQSSMASQLHCGPKREL